MLINNSTWRIFPFIINTGGAQWNKPIIADAVVKFCNIDSNLVADQNHIHKFYMPTPYGKNITHPLKNAVPAQLRPHPGTQIFFIYLQPINKLR